MPVQVCALVLEASLEEAPGLVSRGLCGPGRTAADRTAGGPLGAEASPEALSPFSSN